MNRRPIIITSIIIAIIIGSIVIAAWINNNASKPGVIKDRDTGNSAVIGSTGDPNSNALVVFGENNLYSKGVSQDQFNKLHDTLSQFAKDRLDPTVLSVTVRPQDLKKQNTIFTTTLRIGQTDTLLPIAFKLEDKGGVTVFIQDPQNKYKGNYVGVSGLPFSDLSDIKVDPVSYKNTSIDDPVTISINATSGYRNGAINKMNELGHTIGDFKYTFANYESPFAS